MYQQQLRYFKSKNRPKGQTEVKFNLIFFNLVLIVCTLHIYPKVDSSTFYIYHIPTTLSNILLYSLYPYIQMAPVGGLANKVNFAAPRSFATSFKSDLKETFFPDDPFHDFKGKPLPIKAKKALQYFVPIFEWFPSYSRKLFMYDLLAGITIASLAIPQGISYAKLANIPPIIGLCKLHFFLFLLTKYLKCYLFLCCWVSEELAIALKAPHNFCN